MSQLFFLALLETISSILSSLKRLLEQFARHWFLRKERVQCPTVGHTLVIPLNLKSVVLVVSFTRLMKVRCCFVTETIKLSVPDVTKRSRNSLKRIDSLDS